MERRVRSRQSLPGADMPGSGMADAIRGIGWLTIVVGIIGALAMGLAANVPDPLRWYFGTATVVSSVICGMIFLGFAEIIKLLVQILHTLSELKQERRYQSRRREG